MSIVLFMKDRLVESESHVQTDIEPVRILSKLRLDCRIEPGVTLGDIFKIVAGYPLLVAFIAEYSWCWAIKEFHLQAELPKTDEAPDLQYLRVCRFIAIDNIENDDGREVTLTVDFDAAGELGEHNGLPNLYSIALTPMNAIAHLPVVLDSDCSVYEEGKYEVEELKTSFTLLEVLNAIYSEISFHGGPRETAVVGQELLDMIEEAESGRATLIPLDDIKDSIQ